MAQPQIDVHKFVELVVAKFPGLRHNFHDSRGLIHVQMMEFRIHMEGAIKKDDWATVEKCLFLADTLYRNGDKLVRNAISVSFLENLTLEEDVRCHIEKMMSSDLRKAWAEILKYVSLNTQKQNPKCEKKKHR